MDVTEVASHVKTLADLDKVVILNKAGRPAGRIGWSLGLFFADGETLDKRRLANGVLRDFLAAFPGQVTHHHPADADRLAPIGDADIAAASDAAAEAATKKTGRNANDMYTAELYGFPGGEEVMEPALLYFSINTASRERRAPSAITANMPLTWPADADLAPLVALFIRWCAIVRPEHGTASPGLVLMQGGSTNELVGSFPLLQRFPGLDFVADTRWIAAARKHPRTIRTIGWLTAIDDGFVQALGGLAAVQDALASDDIVLHGFTGGIVIQAGPKPRLGDRNRGDIPAAYRSVARLLQPFVMTAFSVGMFYPLAAHLDTHGETERWLHRFD